MIKSIQNPQQIILVGICFLFVCILDYFTPLHSVGGIGILYTSVILLSMHESRKTIIYTAAFATLLIILNYIYFSNILHSTQQLVIPFNRFISIIGLWLAVIVALKSKQTDQKLLNQRADYTETIEEIIYINSHKVRNPVANIVKIVELIIDDDLSDPNAKQMLAYLHKSARDLEIATREMTETISDKEYNKELFLSSSV